MSENAKLRTVHPFGAPPGILPILAEDAPLPLEVKAPEGLTEKEELEWLRGQVRKERAGRNADRAAKVQANLRVKKLESENDSLVASNAALESENSFLKLTGLAAIALG